MEKEIQNTFKKNMVTLHAGRLVMNCTHEFGGAQHKDLTSRL